jgi:3-oxoacyl-[acyl-carrier protein] reductase
MNDRSKYYWSFFIACGEVHRRSLPFNYLPMALLIGLLENNIINEKTMKFNEKIVLVTGASRGIGREISRQFAAEGAHVVIHYHQNKDAAQATLHSLQGEGHAMIAADISNPASAAQLVETAITQFGRIDVLVNNAGVCDDHQIADVDYQQWQDAWHTIIGTNLLGAAYVTHGVVQQMIQQGGGKIINISSRGAFRGEPDAPAYGASKAALNAMSQSLAKSLAPRHIFVYAVAPSFVETDMARYLLESDAGAEILKQSPLNRLALPEEIAHTVLFLAGENTEYLTGCIIDINGASYLRM